jgi:uncharacterized membrane protein YgdD (TMEM256/DUF423 family)
MTAPRALLLLAALNGFLAVAAGAFGAHAASDPQVREWLRTGAQYQGAHAVAALAAVALAREGGRAALWAAGLFGAGALVFGVSLDALALTGARAWGAVTPLGGLLLLAGWLALGWSALRRG